MRQVRKVLSTIVALAVATLLIVAITPVEAQAAGTGVKFAHQVLKACSSSQRYVISNAQRAVDDAQRQVTYQQGYLRLAQITYNSTRDSVRSEQSRLVQLTKTLNGYIAREHTANRVQLLDLQVAEEKTQTLLDLRLQNLKTAQAFFTNAESALSRKQDGVARAQDNLVRKQTELQRQQAKCY